MELILNRFIFLRFSELCQDDLREALRVLDINISQELCEKYVNFGFRADGDAIKARSTIEKLLLITNLRASSIRRT